MDKKIAIFSVNFRMRKNHNLIIFMNLKIIFKKCYNFSSQ